MKRLLVFFRLYRTGEFTLGEAWRVAKVVTMPIPKIDPVRVARGVDWGKPNDYEPKTVRMIKHPPHIPCVTPPKLENEEHD